MKKLSQVAGLLIVAVLALNLFGISTAQAAEEPVEKADIVLAGKTNGKGIVISSNTATIEGNIHSNKQIVTTGSTYKITGSMSAASSIVAPIRNLEVEGKIKNAPLKEVPDLHEAIKNAYLEQGVLYSSRPTTLVSRDVDSKEVVHASTVSMTAIRSMNLQKSIAAKRSLVLTGKDITGTPDVIYSEEGNIVISANNIELTGLIYAPNGQVTITGKNVTLTGAIVAGSTVITSKELKLLENQQVMNFITDATNKTVVVTE